MYEEYPKDYFVKLEGESERIGRLTVNKISGNQFNLEIDIVSKETKKIWYHVGQIFNFSTEEEILESGVQYLSNFLNRQNND